MARRSYRRRRSLSAFLPKLLRGFPRNLRRRQILAVALIALLLTGGIVVLTMVLPGCESQPVTIATTGAKVDIDDEGTIKISSSDLTQIEAARQWILGIVEEAEVGKIYNGKVVNLVDFGAFVQIMPGVDGLLHISQISDERVNAVTDFLSEGQMVKVKVLDVDNRGRIKLSMKEAKSE